MHVGDQKIAKVAYGCSGYAMVVEHPEAITTEDADRYIEGHEGVRTKTLFMCDRKATAYYMIIMDDMKRLEIKKLEELLTEKGLKLCNPERLMDKLGVVPGCVSLFGLLKNVDKT